MHVDPFAALADPTRRRVLDALRGGERTVNDVVDVVQIHQSGVSRHLQVLKDAGFVTVRADGPYRYYALAPAPFEELEHWLAAYRDVWSARLDRFGAALAARAMARAQQQQQQQQQQQPMAPPTKKP